MANPFEHIKSKDWLYVAGAFASLFALYMALGRGKVTLPGGSAITDVPNVGSAAPNYMSYNIAPYDAGTLQTGSDIAPNPEQCCCDQQCNSASPLADGSAYGNLSAYLTYLQNTNPNYVDLQAAQLKRYAAYFATGESYSKGGIPLGVSPAGLTPTG